MNALFPLPNILLEQSSIPPQTMNELRSRGINLSPGADFAIRNAPKRTADRARALRVRCMGTSRPA